MKRRDFVKRLSALPFIGAVIKPEPDNDMAETGIALFTGTPPPLPKADSLGGFTLPDMYVSEITRMMAMKEDAAWIQSGIDLTGEYE